MRITLGLSVDDRASGGNTKQRNFVRVILLALLTHAPTPEGRAYIRGEILKNEGDPVGMKYVADSILRKLLLPGKHFLTLHLLKSNRLYFPFKLLHWAPKPTCLQVLAQRSNSLYVRVPFVPSTGIYRASGF
jgi:hypothetical protein